MGCLLAFFQRDPGNPDRSGFWGPIRPIVMAAFRPGVGELVQSGVLMAARTRLT